MKHIFGNLMRHRLSVLAIMLLLVLQAYCDLAQPGYTSRIVDVGLQQYGIEDCVMEQMRPETGEALRLPIIKHQAFMNSESLQRNSAKRLPGS